MDADGGLSQARASIASQAAARHEEQLAQAAPTRAADEKAQRVLEVQNTRVKQAISAFLRTAHAEGLQPEHHYAGLGPDRQVRTWYGRWVTERDAVYVDRYVVYRYWVGSGEDSRSAVVAVHTDGRVSWGGADFPAYGCETAVLPCQMSGRNEYPLASGWWNAERGDDEGRIVATADWFIQCSANYLEQRPRPE